MSGNTGAHLWLSNLGSATRQPGENVRLHAKASVVWVVPPAPDPRLTPGEFAAGLRVVLVRRDTPPTTADEPWADEASARFRFWPDELGGSEEESEMRLAVAEVTTLPAGQGDHPWPDASVDVTVESAALHEEE